jgi:hypothetical protein
MVRLPLLLWCVAFAVVGCTRTGPDPAPKPLPTRQTTIDPVNAKLDAASVDTERRRQDIDNAAK